MANLRSEVDASGASNSPLIIGLSDITASRSGTSVTIRYKVYGRNYGEWSYNSIRVWSGTIQGGYAFYGDGYSHTTRDVNYYTDFGTTTVSLGATTSSANVSVGVSQMAWEPSSPAGWYNLTVDGLPTATAPSGVSVSSSDITRTTATLNGTYSNIGSYASLSSETYEWGISTNYGKTGKNMTNLTPNTLYYYRYTVKNTAGLSKSATGSLTTSGNAPDITSVTPVISVGSTTINFNANYDTNASLDSYTIEYGTTESYGTTLTNNNVITTNDNNTVYYYKISVTDNFNRTSVYTGSFTSGGNAPIINMTTNYVRANKASFEFLPTFDTNASFKRLVLQNTYDGEVNKNKFNIEANYSTTSPANFTMDFYGSNLLITGRTSAVRTDIINTKNTSTITLEPGTYTISSRRLSGTFTMSDECIIICLKRKVDDITMSTLNELYTHYSTFTINETTEFYITCSTNNKINNYTNLIVGLQIEENSNMTSYQSYNNTIVYTSQPTDIILENLKSNKHYTMKLTLTDNYDRYTDGEIYYKTPSGMRINNMVATEFKFNGHVILGMKLNGHVLYE